MNHTLAVKLYQYKHKVISRKEQTMTALAFDPPALNAYAVSGASPVATALIAAGSTLAKWETRARTRAGLKRLDTIQYPDIGLTTAEVLHEVAKPFWRA